ncbi:MAG: hypothetical protein AAB368_16235, partial [bacterium]
NEVLRLKRQGVVVAGRLALHAVREPTATEIDRSDRTFMRWLRAHYVDRRPAAERTVDAIVNTLLLELRSAVWKADGEYVLDKPSIIPRFLDIPRCDTWRTALAPVQAYLLHDRPPGGVARAERLLDRVSDFVRHQR